MNEIKIQSSFEKNMPRIEKIDEKKRLDLVQRAIKDFETTLEFLSKDLHS